MLIPNPQEYKFYFWTRCACAHEKLCNEQLMPLTDEQAAFLYATFPNHEFKRAIIVNKTTAWKDLDLSLAEVIALEFKKINSRNTGGWNGNY